MYRSDSRASIGQALARVESGDDDAVLRQRRRVVVRRFREGFVFACFDADDFDLPGGGFKLELKRREAAVS